MDMSELIERTKQNIWQAISDYGKHTDQTSVMDDCTANFVNQLASDSCYARTLQDNAGRRYDPHPERRGELHLPSPGRGEKSFVQQRHGGYDLLRIRGKGGSMRR